MRELAKHYLSLQIEIAFGERDGLDVAILRQLRYITIEQDCLP